jgi:signal transduction histidine kinase
MTHSRELEFARVSKLLHDEIGQVLSAVGLQLDVLRLDFSPQVPQISEHTSEIQKLLERAIEQVRNLSYELNPDIVQRAGLSFAMERLVGRWRDSFSGAIRLLFDSDFRVSPAIGNVFYKIAEHALENAVLHSSATLVEVVARRTNLKNVMEIRDNGVGFSVAERRGKAPGVGLILMDYYASNAGVVLRIESQAGKGTSVRLEHGTKANE